MNTFWDTIAKYNSATWPIQIVLTLSAFVVIYLLAKRPSRRSTIIAKVYLIVLYVWIAVAYYAIYCAERHYSILLSIYWGILAAAWVKDLAQDQTQFVYRDKFKFFGLFVLLLPLIYPLASIVRGLSFPYITTPVMPCTVAIYTIGLLLLFTRRVNIFIVLLLLNWAMLGVTKTWFFGIPEDFILALTAIPALYIFSREYFALDLHTDTKPQSKYINALLIMVCVGICIALCWALYAQIVHDL